MLIWVGSFHDFGVPLAHAATLTRSDIPHSTAALALTLAASLLFYPAMYLGAAIGNSHPLLYAIPSHPLLSRSSMIAQQEILQTTVGKGLGMIFCRMALGDPPQVTLMKLACLITSLAHGPTCVPSL